MRQPENDRAAAHDGAERAVWRQSCATELPEDEGARFLDLAAFADDRLDPDERERVAAMLARDPAAAADVAAARVLAGAVGEPSAVLVHVMDRACGLVAAAPPRNGALPWRRMWYDVAQWGSLAAAVVLASWLGFAMGSDASRAYRDAGQPVAEDGLLPELLDPSTGFLRELSEGIQT